MEARGTQDLRYRNIIGIRSRATALILVALAPAALLALSGRALRRFYEIPIRRPLSPSRKHMRFDAT
jgi:hypothetical protein